MLTPGDGSTAVHALATHGHWFRATFHGGDWGVADPEWGHAYMSPEWLLRHVQPRWRLRRFEPARLDGNQDLYALERAP
jgi:hypothetical protein